MDEQGAPDLTPPLKAHAQEAEAELGEVEGI